MSKEFKALLLRLVVAAALGWLWVRLTGMSKEFKALLLGLVVAVNYAALYLVYFRFYVLFGLRPSDVGLTKIRLLQESILAPMFLPYTWASSHHTLVAWAFGGALGARVLIWIVFQRTSASRPQILKEASATLLLTLIIGYVVLLSYAYIELSNEAKKLGHRVREEGQIVVSWVNIKHLSPFLDVQALPVDIITSKGAVSPPLTTGCMFYLGQAEGDALLFDVRRELVIRVQTQDFFIVTHPRTANYTNQRLPVSCLSDEGNKVAS